VRSEHSAVFSVSLRRRGRPKAKLERLHYAIKRMPRAHALCDGAATPCEGDTMVEARLLRVGFMLFMFASAVFALLLAF
jgi:hypothetical protein